MKSDRLIGCLALIPILAFSAGAGADEFDQCRQLALSLDAHYFGFPDIEAETINPLATWRASCASEPPSGRGQVFALCEARLAGEGHVFFWYKTGIEAETSGYEICDF